MHEGFEVWLLNGCGLNLCFPRALSKAPDFNNEYLATSHLNFAMEIRPVLGGTDSDNHTERRQAGIYTYIMHNAST